MEVSALKHPTLPGLRGPAPLLRLQADERLITLVRRGHQDAFEAIVARYQARLLAFCRHMLGSREDAEDVLQEVFAAAFNAILADERPINVRPWLYRIARNRSLNHLRRHSAIGVDSMDVHLADAGQTTGEKVSKREDFRLLLEDIGRLPETQRTALLLREMEALSYQQIAEAMDTTVPSVKSLLVRARVSLAEAAESRRLTCDEVRLELGAIAEGISEETAPIRRHVKDCDRCRAFRGQLRENNRALAAVLPVAPLLLFKHLAIKKLLVAKLGLGGGAGGAGVSTATAGGAMTAGGASTAGAVGALGGAGATGGGAGILTFGAGTLATKAVAGLAAAAIVTAGAVEARHGAVRRVRHSEIAVTHPVLAARTAPTPAVASETRQALTGGTLAFAHLTKPAKPKRHHAKPTPAKVKSPLTPVAATVPAALPVPPHAVAPKPTTQQVSSTTVLPPQPAAGSDGSGPAPSGTTGAQGGSGTTGAGSTTSNGTTSGSSSSGSSGSSSSGSGSSTTANTSPAGYYGSGTSSSSASSSGTTGPAGSQQPPPPAN